MVFTPTAGPTNLGDWRNWWRWQPGAFWRKPFGPDSSIDDRLQHPVVHIAFEDAVAYADWVGMRLPTEAEHEYAARGGLEGAAFAWGDEAYPDGVAQANSWLGRFPYDNQGVGGTAPVGSYPPNGYGLYDMIANVWEWTTDFYTPAPTSASRTHPVDAGKRTNLLAAASAQDGFPDIPRRVLKGGSHLCSPDYCLRFRPAARSPQAEDTGDVAHRIPAHPLRVRAPGHTPGILLGFDRGHAPASPVEARSHSWLRSPTSSSSGEMTSASATSARTPTASWAIGRRTSTASPTRGVKFTDYYGEQSCTAGRAAFITGQNPITAPV